MGAYLSSPVRDKESRDFDGHCLSYGASSMQGWRMTQEDAHSCQVDFDKEKNCSLFAVYDGHGGAEVAQYSSMHFPNYLKNTPQYAKGLINEALEESFLGFDATLTEDIVIRQLKELAGVNNDAEEADEEVKNEAAALCEEASMPLEKVLERYGGQANAGSVMGKSIYSLRKRQKFQSPLVRTKADKSDGKENLCEFFPSETDGTDLPSVSPASSTGNKELDEIKTKLEDKLINGFCENEADRRQPEVTNGSSGAVTSEISTENEDLPVSKGKESDVSETSDVTSTSDAKAEENGDKKVGSVSGQKMKSEPHGPVVISSSSKTPSSNNKEVEAAGPSSSSGSTEQPGADKEENSDEDTEDEDDPDSEDGEEKWASENEDDDSDDDVEGFKFVGDEDDDEEDDDDDVEDEEEEEEGMNAMSWNEEPGVDSGCTAVVALLRGRTLYVANAGDSRCVLSRGGVAVEMSSDHKPEDSPERERIVKAGGKVTCDGRVNGGLNLSRALGDHGYKQNTSLGAREQMITALPDIRTITLTDEDNFMVLACDGIWNVMSSQQVVEFVQKQFDNGVTKLSSICEEMFEACLAPDTAGDGTGCDNMTCIIVRFNRLSEDPGDGDGADASKKRRVESTGADDCSAAKRTRAESCENSDDL